MKILFKLYPFFILKENIKIERGTFEKVYTQVSMLKQRREL